MKKIGKLSINHKKFITNKELLNLKGGYYGPYLNDHWKCECDGVEKTVYASDCETAKSAAENSLECEGTRVVCC
jgi:hypothetical protein